MTPAFGGGDNLWEALLHYVEGESRIEDPSFFLHPEGRTHPEKEIGEFLRLVKEDPSISCRFPARAYYVKKFLGMALEETPCPELDRFLDAVRGDRISIVFADAHINSPASMFGHTFLRIFEEEGSLYSFIANYSAKVERDPGLTYAIKGLTGGYRGYFSVAPFYEKIREYAGIEGRDLWEYELEVDPELLHLLKLHLFELREIYSNYYFFTKNCSSEVFYLLRILYPEENLTLKTSWTVPVDTLKFLKERGLIKGERYSPSLLRQIDSGAERLRDDEVDEIKGWVQKGKALGEAKSGLYYETAGNYVRFLFYRGSLDQKRYRKLYLQSLRMRRMAGKGGKVEVKKPPSPLSTHSSQRLSFGGGIRDSGGDPQFVYLLSYRPVYHDLLDRPNGFRRGSEIRFSQVDLEYSPGQGVLNLKRWILIRILSLEPVKAFYRPVSWFVNLSYERQPGKEGDEVGFAALRSGGGYTLSLLGLNLSFLAEARSRAYSTSSGSLGGGVRTVLLVQGGILSAIASLSYGGFLLGPDRGDYLLARSGLSLHPFRNYSFRVLWEGYGPDLRNRYSLTATINLYF